MSVVLLSMQATLLAAQWTSTFSGSIRFAAAAVTIGGVAPAGLVAGADIDPRGPVPAGRGPVGGYPVLAISIR